MTVHKTCSGCVFKTSDPFVSPCRMCREHDDLPHWSDKKPILSAKRSVVRTQARMISKLLHACHRQRDRARDAEKSYDSLYEDYQEVRDNYIKAQQKIEELEDHWKAFTDGNKYTNIGVEK